MIQEFLFHQISFFLQIFTKSKTNRYILMIFNAPCLIYLEYHIFRETQELVSIDKITYSICFPLQILKYLPNEALIFKCHVSIFLVKQKLKNTCPLRLFWRLKSRATQSPSSLYRVLHIFWNSQVCKDLTNMSNSGGNLVTYSLIPIFLPQKFGYE